MSSRSRKKGHTKDKRKGQQGKPKKQKDPVIKARGGGFRIRSTPRVGFLGTRPREGAKRNRMTAHGLTMQGGTVSGVTEISAGLSLASSAQNVPGQVIALIPLHPQLIAPGTRLSDIAAMYDQYVFTKVQFELDPSLPYAVGGRLLGFVERDATDPIGAMGTAVGNVIEWMDHGSAVDRPIQGGTSQARLLFPNQGKYMYKIARGPVGGYYLNKVQSTNSNTDMNNCYQGQFCLMLHTALNSEGGQALSYPVPLGPLRVKWTLKFREAAERPDGQGVMDKHFSSGGGTLSNPFNWSSTLTKQATMTAWSNLGLQSYYFGTGSGTVRGVSFSANIDPTIMSFPLGFYYVAWFIDFSNSGSTSFYLNPAANPSNNFVNQTGVTWVDWDLALPQLSTTNVLTAGFMQFQVTTPGPLVLFQPTGTQTGYSLDTYASFVVIAIPASAISMLKHKNLQMRSLAFQKHMANQGSGREIAAQIRQELGLPPKVDDDASLDRVWQNILREEAKQESVNARALGRTESKEDKWAVDEDDWDGKEYDFTSGDATPSEPRPGYVWPKLDRQRTLRVHQDDEKSDRGKAPREQPRASSLKS